MRCTLAAANYIKGHTVLRKADSVEAQGGAGAARGNNDKGDKTCGKKIE